jgi:hypothetical protein
MAARCEHRSRRVPCAVQLLRYKPWARPSAVTLEVLGIVLAASRLGRALGPALVSIVLSLAVITLLISAGRSRSD